MERRVTTELGRRADGTTVCRHQLVNPPKENLMAKAHSYYSRSERRAAFFNHKYPK